MLNNVEQEKVSFICVRMGLKNMSLVITGCHLSELPRPIPWKSVESDLGFTSRIYFDIVTLTLQKCDSDVI